MSIEVQRPGYCPHNILYRLKEKINMRAKVELTDFEEDGGEWLVTGW